MTYRFYKTEEDRWFIDIPEWPPELIDALEMVAGADTMLDILSGGNNSIWLSFDEEPNINNDIREAELELVSATDDGFGGAFYNCKLNEKYGRDDYQVWLCNVTEYVFGKFPQKIYIYA